MKLDKIFASKKWQKAQGWTREFRDHLDRPLDPGIVYVVTVFRYLNIHTTMSCEGHLEGGFYAPWIMVLSPEGDVIEQKDLELLSKYGSKVLPKKLRQQRIDIIPRNFAYSKPLARCIEKFYKTRNTSWKNQLIIIWSMNGECRLISQGAWLNAFEPQTKKQKNLQSFRKEMLAFSDYLLTHYKK